MAGYKTPDDLFVNATTKNDQIVRQRESYQQKNLDSSSRAKLGIGTNTSSTFPKFKPNEIFEKSCQVFTDLDSITNTVSGDQRQGNPDFQKDVALDSRGASDNLFGDLANAKDLPNKKGPNIVVPDIDKLNSGSIETTATEPVGGEHDKSRGFGWSDDRNEEGADSAVIGSYFSKHYSATAISQSPPVLGEANDQGSDDPIDY